MEKRFLVDEREWLLRRSYTPEKKYMNPDGTAHSRVFKLREKDNGELSVNVESLTTPEKAIVDKTKFLLFKVANKTVVEVGLNSFHAPLEDGTNEAHAVIVGMRINDEITPGLLARASTRFYF